MNIGVVPKVSLQNSVKLGERATEKDDMDESMLGDEIVGLSGDGLRALDGLKNECGNITPQGLD